MELDLLFQLAILLIAGLVGARLIRLIRLPDVTGYLILGLLIGPSVLGLFTSEGVAALSVISDVALGFIAFTVGGEFKFEYFRRVGATPIVIAFFESIVAVILVVRHLKRASAHYRDEDKQEPKFHGPVYTVDYEEVDDEDEKGK